MASIIATGSVSRSRSFRYLAPILNFCTIPSRLHRQRQSRATGSDVILSSNSNLQVLFQWACGALKRCLSIPRVLIFDSRVWRGMPSLASAHSAAWRFCASTRSRALGRSNQITLAFESTCRAYNNLYSISASNRQTLLAIYLVSADIVIDDFTRPEKAKEHSILSVDRIGPVRCEITF